jgi:hypothetical protein
VQVCRAESWRFRTAGWKAEAQKETGPRTVRLGGREGKREGEAEGLGESRARANRVG